ncbi:MAG: hypothetical protein WBD40_10875 [Tepidisphaeraceae bacterium]
MPRYDASAYDPPAPVAEVGLRAVGSSDTATTFSAQMLIDSGADVTLLPRAAVLRVGVQPQMGAQYELIGFDGNRTKADAVDLEMILLNKAFRGRYLLIDADHGILGRDVLASVSLLLDGPRQEWSAV